MKKAVILGINGSIGTSTLKGISAYKEKIQITGACSFHHREETLALCHKYGIKNLCIENLSDINNSDITDNTDGIRTYTSLSHMLSDLKPDVIVNGVSSSAGLNATIKCFQSDLNNHTVLALANKESIVTGGRSLFERAEKKKIRIIPVDSEHSCIYELIKAHGRENISKILLTASGGPFLDKDISQLTDIPLNMVINHPTWKMGKKISIDSATMANKGLEVIEAHYLFDFNAEDIITVIHPQSVVHSMVMCRTGQIYAQMSPPDMSFPIMNAITEGEQKELFSSPLDFNNMLNLSFIKADLNKYPLLKTAYDTIKKNADPFLPMIFCCADEVAVNLFVEGKITFGEIPKYVGEAMKVNTENLHKNFDSLFETYNIIKNRICSLISPL